METHNRDGQRKKVPQADQQGIDQQLLDDILVRQFAPIFPGGLDASNPSIELPPLPPSSPSSLASLPGGETRLLVVVEVIVGRNVIHLQFLALRD